MRNVLVMLLFALLPVVTGCTTAPPPQDQPKVFCPACGAEVDAIFHKHF